MRLLKKMTNKAVADRLHALLCHCCHPHQDNGCREGRLEDVDFTAVLSILNTLFILRNMVIAS
jgi:hypothetical protein